MAYCTVLELKGWNDRTTAAKDTELGLVIDTASTWIDQHCQRSFLLSDVDSRQFAPCGQTIAFGAFSDLVECISVASDDNGDGTFETVWPTTDYELLPLNPLAYGPEARPYTSIRSVNRAWPGNRLRVAQIEITATWGWPAVPAAVRHACLIQASRIFLRRQSPDGVIGGFQDFGPVRVSGRVDPDVADLLAAYRHPATTVMVA
jgi:hypothetical protein